MLVLINSNRLTPEIAPIGLDYVASAARAHHIDTRVIDLGLASDPRAQLETSLRQLSPALIGISCRNIDDCFWPSARSFLGEIRALVEELRGLSDAPIVLGGVGVSIFARRVAELTSVDFVIRGDGELALVRLYEALGSRRDFSSVPGLIYRSERGWEVNAPAWPSELDEPRPRDAIDNAEYFRRGGQIGLETKRGCPRRCIYCADPVAKGRTVRRRSPKRLADELRALLAQGVDVLHLCDGEFNVPGDAAREFCETLISEGLASRLRFYLYAAVRPFDASLARLLARAGCAGINFTGDSADPEMLRSYRAAHQARDLESVVKLCRAENLACMVDLLLGGPGETPESVRRTIDELKRIGPDCVGAGLGMRLYPDTLVVDQLKRQGPLEDLPGVLRHYQGPVDLVWPTFYISPALGTNPARLVREIIGDDPRFFPPSEVVAGGESGDHNYSDNAPLAAAIAAGARGAYWDILRRL